MDKRGTSKKMVLRGKKGMFFMILAIMLITFFLVSFTLFSGIKERKTTQKRVETLNNFVFAAEEDLVRRTFISGFRIIFLLNKKIIETGLPITNLNSSFQEAFYNGTLNGEPQSLMNGATFQDIEQVLREKSNKLGANLSLTNSTVSITQEGPWKVKITLTTRFVTEDISGLVKWNKTLVTEAFIPIENFGDPLYALSTNSLVFENITHTPYTSFVSGNDVSNLLAHTQGPFYIASPTGPSFLDRLQGITSANPNGIESLVDLSNLASLGINVKDKSAVDYIYFSTNDPSSCNVVPSGTPSWFKLDSAHLTTYEVSCAT